MSEDISKKTLMALVLIALLLSVVGALNILGSQKAIVIGRGNPVSDGRVFLEVTDENYVSPVKAEQPKEFNDGGQVSLVVS